MLLWSIVSGGCVAVGRVMACVLTLDSCCAGRKNLLVNMVMVDERVKMSWS